MAQIKVKNPVTGGIFTINDTDFDSVYKPLGWTKVSDTTSTPSSTTSTNTSGWVDPATGQSTPKGVGELKTEYDKRMNKTTTTSTTTTNTQAPTGTTSNVQKATLYGPNDTPEVVEVGSARAAELQAQGWGLSKGSYKAPTTTNTQAPTGTTINNEIPAEDKAWINAAYQKYFDRPATSSELANWAKETPAALDQFLNKEKLTYGYVSKADGIAQKARYDSAIATIESSNLPDDIKSLWKTVVGMYPDATDFNADEILNTFNKIKDETIDPYYKELADIAIADVKDSYKNLISSREMELESERALAGKDIRQAKSSLEKSGMTFTGKAVEELGADSAYAQDGNTAMPTQIPFAGMDGTFYEGNVNQANRLIATSTAARYAKAQQDLGRKAEDYLGTSEASKLGIPYTPAGVNVSGSLGLAAEEKKASTLQTIINQWREKQNLKQNI